MNSINGQEVDETAENQMNVPPSCAAKTVDAQANSSATQPCASDETEELSALRPSWKAIPNALNNNGISSADTVRVKNETVGAGATSVHANVYHTERPLRKQKGLYTSITPPTTNLRSGVNYNEFNGHERGDSVRRSYHSTNDIDTLQIKIPLDSSIWQRISARSLNNCGDLSQEPNGVYRSTEHHSTPLAIRNSELGLHFRISVSDSGVIVIRLRGSTSIELTVDNAIKIYDGLNQIQVALSNTASSSAMIHPNGRLHQYNSRIDIMAADGLERNRFVRFAKMWYKGISFTNENSAITYLVDAAGARTTTDHFVSRTAYDHLLNGVFYENSHHGYSFIEEAFKIVNNAAHFIENGTEIFNNHYMKISQDVEGHIHVTRLNNKGAITLNPNKGSISLTTPLVYCTASLGKSSHLFVKRADRRLHFNGSTFCVRNAGHSAGFDARNQFKIFN